MNLWIGRRALKAKDITGQAPGGKRTILIEALPLDTPFVIEIFPVYACNFACKYCILSLDKAKRYFISDKITMDFNLYKKCINDIALFPHKVKVLRFSGIGEPLLHKKIADMVGYAASRGAAQTIEILTNAYLLTPELSNRLIAAGLTRLVVSVQGTTKAKYKEICGKDIDFEGLVDNLKYFYNKKGNTHVYVKIMDLALEGKDDEKRFRDIFEGICDSIAIEYAVPIQSGVNYSRVLKDKPVSFTQFGMPVDEVQVCPQPFFSMYIKSDGKAAPCYSYELPKIMGDCNNHSVREIWNGKNFQDFRRKMLDGIKNACEVCARCNIIKYRQFQEDNLNNYVERLKKLYGI